MAVENPGNESSLKCDNEISNGDGKNFDESDSKIGNCDLEMDDQLKKRTSLPHLNGHFTTRDENSNINGEIHSKANENGRHSSLVLTVLHADTAVAENDIEKPKDLQTVESQTSQENFKAYKTRFWVLAVYYYSAFLMLMNWGTFSPILESTQYAYGWSDWYFALLEAFGSIFSIMFMLPFGYVVHKYGLRMAMILISVFLTVATGIRCVTKDEDAFAYMAGLSAIINGMTSGVILSLPPLISVVWFPVNERATATAISATSLQLGITGMYFSPLIVKSPDDVDESPQDMRSDIQILMFIYFGMAVLCLVCSLVYLPPAPKTPPSESSKVERINFLKSIKIIIRQYDVMAIILIYTFSTSIPFCWLSIINLSVACLGITQDESMWIAVAASLASIAMTVTVGKLSDVFRGYMKVSIGVLLLASSACFLWFLLITEEVIPASKPQVYISVILGIGLQYSGVPLMMELAVELAYPSPENAVGTMFSFMLEVCDIAFLFLMMIPTDCYVWLSYALVASTCCSVIPLIFVKEVYHRSAVDNKVPETHSTNGVTSVLHASNTPSVTTVSNMDNYNS